MAKKSNFYRLGSVVNTGGVEGSLVSHGVHVAIIELECGSQCLVPSRNLVRGPINVCSDVAAKLDKASAEKKYEYTFSGVGIPPHRLDAIADGLGLTVEEVYAELYESSAEKTEIK